MNGYKIKRKDNVVRVKDASDGFIDKTATVCKVVDNGNGYTHQVLAEMFGIKKTQVGYILNNQRWAQ